MNYDGPVTIGTQTESGSATARFETHEPADRPHEWFGVLSNLDDSLQLLDVDVIVTITLPGGESGLARLDTADVDGSGRRVIRFKGQGPAPGVL